jgi:hypothetical protein
VDRLDDVAAAVLGVEQLAGDEVDLELVVVGGDQLDQALLRAALDARDIVPGPHAGLGHRLREGEQLIEVDGGDAGGATDLARLDPAPLLLDLQEQAGADDDDQRQAGDRGAPVVEPTKHFPRVHERRAYLSGAACRTFVGPAPPG